jgi:diguanylate cyclase (GGDEF)-like protein
LNFNHFDKEGVFDHEDIRAIQGLLPEITLALARVRDHERLREQTLRDPLTGVYNRRYLNELLTHELEQARHYGHPFAFLMIDFDNFFAVNDRFGHLMGDQVLREIAQILRRAVRASDTVIRYGGDEFLVVLLKAAQPDAERVAHRLEERCEAWLQEFQRRHGKLRLSISIGLALWTPESQKEISAVLDEADQFMYRRKRTRAKSRLRS